MKKFILGCIGSCAIGHLSLAAWGLKFEVSNDNGATWRSDLGAQQGWVIKFRFGVDLNAVIVVFPVPASFALFGLSLAIAGRRRR